MARKPIQNTTFIPPRWATYDQVAAYIGVDKRTVRDMRRDGRLTAYSLGSRVIRFDLNEVDAAMGRVVA